MEEKILITGASGQLGTELTEYLSQFYKNSQIIIIDIHPPAEKSVDVLFETLDVTDAKTLGVLVKEHKITQIYHLASILSARGEQNPLFAWQINMQGLLNVLEVSKELNLYKIYIPSSIAVFGEDTPKNNTPQKTIMNPNTVYGISKQAGELWGKYYFEKYGLDVRSLRYPGLISYKTLPGGGTTDYAIDIFYKALEGGFYECFLRKDTLLPMMYMPDALKATLQLMDSESDKISIRTSYNITAMSFSPEELAKEIKKHIPEFHIQYMPDFRQNIADSWAASIDDTQAEEDWQWKAKYNLEMMVRDMLLQISTKKKEVSLNF